MPMRFKKIALALLTLALLFVWFGPDAQTRTDMWNAAFYKEVPVRVIRQRATAFHEAAHTVAAAILRPMHPTPSLRVFIETPMHGGDTLYGQADIDVSVRPKMLRDGLEVASAAYAGIIGERLLVMMEENADLADARIATWALRTGRYGYAEFGEMLDGSILVGGSKEELEVQIRLMYDSRAAMACAEGIVKANRDVIAALADRINEEPARFGRRRLNAGQLKAFFAANRPVKPDKACDF